MKKTLLTTIILTVALAANACIVGSDDEPSGAEAMANLLVMQQVSSNLDTYDGGTYEGGDFNCSSSFSTAIANAATAYLNSTYTTTGEEGQYCVFAYDNLSGITTYPYAYADPYSTVDISLSTGYYNDVPSSSTDRYDYADVGYDGYAEAGYATTNLNGDFRYYWVYIFTGSSCSTSCTFTFGIYE